MVRRAQSRRWPVPRRRDARATGADTGGERRAGEPARCAADPGLRAFWLFFVPLGVGAHLQRWGVASARIREMGWGQRQALGGVRIVSTPSRHYSGRRLGDRNATLWTSWSVLGAKQRFFVSGDTGYSDHFGQIGAQFGPFELAFVKVGACGPGRLRRHRQRQSFSSANTSFATRKLSSAAGMPQ
jgi:hypothetical protein